MSLAQLRFRGSGAELRLLDPTAACADEVMMVLWPAADVGVPALPEQRVYTAAGAQELDRPIRGRKAEPRLQPAGTLMQLGDGKAAPGLLDCPEDSPPLRSGAGAGWERELVLHGRNRT